MDEMKVCRENSKNLKAENQRGGNSQAGGNRICMCFCLPNRFVFVCVKESKKIIEDVTTTAFELFRV